jgi:hypothetical protein
MFERQKKLLSRTEFTNADRSTQVVALYDHGQHVQTLTERDLTVDLYRYNDFNVRVEFEGSPRRLISITVLET